MSTEVVEHLHPLVQLTATDISRAVLPISKTENELSARLAELPEATTTRVAEYVPEHHSRREFPCAARLADGIRIGAIASDMLVRDFDLRPTYVRRILSQDPSEYQGPALDVTAGIGETREANIDPAAQVVRWLFNVGTTTLRLNISRNTRNELNQGRQPGDEGYIPADRKQVIPDLGKKALAIVEIPPLQDDVLHGVRFPSSQLPYAGVIGRDGHFIVSFGGYADRRQVDRIFMTG